MSYFSISVRSIGVMVISALFLVFLLVPQIASAQQIVIPCEGPDCQFCDLVTLADSIMKFVVLLSIILAAAGITYGGFLYVTAAGDTGKIKQAHKTFVSVLIGFVFILAAWIIIATMSRALLGSGGLPWDDLKCVGNEGVNPQEEIDRSENTSHLVPGKETVECEEHNNCPPAHNPTPGPVNGWTQEAEDLNRAAFEEEGMLVWSSDGTGKDCQGEARRGCTDLGGLQPQASEGTLEFARDCREARGTDCNIIITGGSEQLGHSRNGTYTHANGYKVDIDDTASVNDYIEGNFANGVKPDGSLDSRCFSRRCRIDDKGNAYNHHDGHWDVTFFN